MSINQLVIGVLLLVIGLFNFFSKASVALIAGYNTKSAEEKSKRNETAIRKFIGIMLIVEGVVMLLSGLLIQLNILSSILPTLSWVLFILIIILGLIYLNTSNRFNITK